MVVRVQLTLLSRRVSRCALLYLADFVTDARENSSWEGSLLSSTSPHDTDGVMEVSAENIIGSICSSKKSCPNEFPEEVKERLVCLI